MQVNKIWTAWRSGARIREARSSEVKDRRRCGDQKSEVEHGELIDIDMGSEQVGRINVGLILMRGVGRMSNGTRSTSVRRTKALNPEETDFDMLIEKHYSEMVRLRRRCVG